MQKQEKETANAGFTLIEILVVIGLIALLAAVVIVAINPARQFAQGRDAQRTSNLNSILNAVSQRIADNKGVFEGTFKGGDGVDYICGLLPATTTLVVADMASGTTTESAALKCLTPTYIQALPVDPSGKYTGANTGYSIYKDSGSGRIHVIATETEPNIPRTAILEIVR
ncbi:MAG: type II secretion system protein [Minisyncoccales bacterium]